MDIFSSKSKLHFIKNWYYRITMGAGCCDVYTLKYYFAKNIIKPLKLFKERNMSYPMGLTPEEWDKILDDMIFSFDYIVRDNTDFIEFNKKDWAKVERGLKLFGKYFLYLWI